MIHRSLSRHRTFLLGGFTAGIYLSGEKEIYISLDLTSWGGGFFLISHSGKKKVYGLLVQLEPFISVNYIQHGLHQDNSIINHIISYRIHMKAKTPSPQTGKCSAPCPKSNLNTISQLCPLASTVTGTPRPKRPQGLTSSLARPSRW